MSKNLEKFVIIVIFYFKTNKKISKPPQKDLFGYMVFVIWEIGLVLIPGFFRAPQMGVRNFPLENAAGIEELQTTNLIYKLTYSRHTSPKC